MARFFIDRPIFAWVIAIVIMLAGALSIGRLALEQYPDIAPTQISVSATYSGASAKTVEDSVTQIIEQQMKGLDRMQSMSSTSDSNGRARVTLSFTAGTNSDVALMQVQNKVQQAMSRLPQSVQNQGVTVFFSLILGPLNAGIEIHYFAVSDSSGDPEENTRRLVEAIADARLVPNG